MAYFFEGYPRLDGSAGTRNYIGVVCSVVCSSVIAKEISESVHEAIPIVHTNGCAQLGDDFKVTKNMLVGVASNPNLYAALLVGLGCETNQISGLLKSIPKTKPIQGIGIQQLAGGENTIKKGIQIAKQWAVEITEEKRERLPISSLTVGIVTTDMDESTLNKVSSVVGGVVDLLVDNDATVIMGLTDTLEPAGSILSQRSENEEVKNKLSNFGEGLHRKRWKYVENQLITHGSFSDEKKKIAALEVKMTGKNQIRSLLDYSDIPIEKGLHLMKSSSNIVETVSNMASSGCNIVMVVSSRGILTGSIALPCMTVAPQTSDGPFNELIDHLITEDEHSIQVKRVISELLNISSGKQTNLEKFELGEFSIPHVGTTF
ncbi:altronate hydrolase [Peribacillus muralis]|uniref:Altronate hydrolase n=1 Tax=Peribacillus muralis TaxID=264697 RepID=A0A1B3XTA8_9BACI|nr:UxaA family hydrolase [Peribacillus muralis]AOH56447.1 altronate hydrolase [Peribacillus muralis]